MYDIKKSFIYNNKMKKKIKFRLAELIIDQKAIDFYAEEIYDYHIFYKFLIFSQITSFKEEVFANLKDEDELVNKYASVILNIINPLFKNTFELMDEEDLKYFRILIHGSIVILLELYYDSVKNYIETKDLESYVSDHVAIFYMVMGVVFKDDEPIFDPSKSSNLEELTAFDEEILTNFVEEIITSCTIFNESLDPIVKRIGDKKWKKQKKKE